MSMAAAVCSSMSMAAILGLLLWLAPFAAAIPTVRLNNGVEMPIISAGTAGYNDSQAALAVRAALAGNVTAIHTAFDYFNLAGVAKGLEARPRREIFLASMTSPCVHDSPPARNVTDAGACEALTTRELESLLASLNTTYPAASSDGVAFRAGKRVDIRPGRYLDLVMLHGPSEPFGYEGACSEAVCKLNSAQWAAYEKFLRAGKARAVGVSNYCQSCLECLSGTTPAVNQLQYHVGSGADPEALLSFNRAWGVNVQAYSPLASGAVVRDADVAKIAAKVGKSAAQVALRYVLQNGAKPSVVVKASKPAYLAEDLDVFDFELSAADVAALDAKTTPAGQQDGRPSWGCAA